MLDERKSEVLRALVEEYIVTGQPVSSTAVLERSGLGVSSATIRNDLASLESEGFATQPHRSAGRVPSAKAYRYYVDHLSPAPLRVNTRTRIHQFFSAVHRELGRLLQETSEFVAELTHYPAVVLGPGLRGEELRGIHLVGLGPQVALVVMVTDAGRVSQELVRLPGRIELEDLEVAERFLSRHLEGQTLAGTAGFPVPPGELPSPVDTIVDAVTSAVGRSEQVSRHVYLGGTSQMASLWEDLTDLHRVLELLERHALMLRVLEAAGHGTEIRIGEELAVGRPPVDLAVVSTGYQVAGQEAGRVGVLGPMRMDYRRAISVVEEVSEGLAESLGS